mmetsp:Transcript_39651/g.98203  ORF Transcript_39651/g.98203 Transcript_39651/m.98203 type:complete len:266 (-) Transcript_39651:930-1727(-)
MSFPTRLEPMPTQAAPASHHCAALAGDTPPLGRMFKFWPRGPTSRIDLSIAGDDKPAWKSFIIRHPRRCKSQHSLGVNADDIARMPWRWHSSMKPFGSIGESANVPPSDLISPICETVSSITVPTPSMTSAGSALRSPESTAFQSLLSSVTSIARHPIAASSTPRAMATSGSPLARKMARTPAAWSPRTVCAIAAAAACGSINGGNAPLSFAAPGSHASLPAKALSALASCSPLTLEKSPAVSWQSAASKSARRSASTGEPTGLT